MISFLKRLFNKKTEIVLYREDTESFLTITEKFYFRKDQNKSIIVDAFVTENYPDWAVVSHS